MPELASGRFEAGVDIGGHVIAISSHDVGFIRIVEGRYANFLCPAEHAYGRLEVVIAEHTPHNEDIDLEVRLEGGRWLMDRGDFLAEWDPRTRLGWIRQSANHYSIDSVLRIVHSLVLAEGDGFLLHSASAVRAGRAFLFSGVSGAGKTTLARLAPADAMLLTDEISYVRRRADGYHAFGTPFAGELGIAGEKTEAPIAALYFLKKGAANAVQPIAPEKAAPRLLRNILFFAHESKLVGQIFERACDFVSATPVYELTFRPEAEAWGLIQ